jgi:hypothetical protein
MGEQEVLTWSSGLQGSALVPKRLVCDLSSRKKPGTTFYFQFNAHIKREIEGLCG